MWNPLTDMHWLSTIEVGADPSMHLVSLTSQHSVRMDHRTEAVRKLCMMLNNRINVSIDMVLKIMMHVCNVVNDRYIENMLTDFTMISV